MKSTYFVTGTDTGVGKTVVSAILARGLSAHYWKPVQTGSAEGTDSDFVRRSIGADYVHAEAFSFAKPISPHLAAEGHSRQITVAACLAQAQTLPRPLIIEGAGGVLVPLNGRELMIDLIKQLGAPVIVVAGTQLGTINHSLLTIEALRARQIPIFGLVMNGLANVPVQESIAAIGKVKILGHVPDCSDFHEETPLNIFRSFAFTERIAHAE